MELLNPMIIVPLSVGLIFIIMGWITLKFPPKKINHLYGYRTKSSMKSQERWNFAQSYSAKEMIKWGALYGLTALFGFLPLFKGALISTIVAMSTLILLVVLLFNRTEKAIAQKFD